MTAGSHPTLGRLEPVDPREVWPHEALDFTPWLLQNVDVLSDILGMDLVLDVAEHPVGDFSLDLKGYDASTNEVVIVENQLATSDHTHLGQILTYAAGTDPTTIVWIAPHFREEHRSAIDWLNARTDEATRFFAVQLAVVRIGSSVPAPAFRLVAHPNDWEKTVRAATTRVELSDKQKLYQLFWARWIDVMAAAGVGWTRGSRTTVASWYPISAGVTGVTFNSCFTRRGLLSDLYFEDPDRDLNMRRFRHLQARSSEFETAYGGSLEWDAMDRYKATRIGDYLDGADITDQARWDDYLDWFLDRQGRLRVALAHVGGVPESG